VQLVGGSETQIVSEGVLESSTPASETHTWTVRATTSGTKQLTVTGEGGTMGETIISSDPVSFDADCSPPAVKPSGTTMTPNGVVACGTDRVIETRLLNDSHTDAQSAQVSVALPSGVELVAGLQMEPVSGELLELQTTSEPHAWTVRQTQPGVMPLTITGSGQSAGQPYGYPEQLALACTQDPGTGPLPLESRTTLEKIKLRRGKLVARGTVLSGEGAPIGGEVVVEWRRRGRSREKEADLAGGLFKAGTRVCQPGRWRASARFLGLGAHAPSASGTRSIKVDENELRC
jgi:hypothetical protein